MVLPTSGDSAVILSSVTYLPISLSAGASASISSGKSQRPISIRYAMPATASSAPIFVNSNTPSAARPCFCARLSARRFDDVPMSVQTPPICAANAIGISTRAGDVRERADAKREWEERRDERDVLDE